MRPEKRQLHGLCLFVFVSLSLGFPVSLFFLSQYVVCSAVNNIDGIKVNDSYNSNNSDILIEVNIPGDEVANLDKTGCI